MTELFLTNIRLKSGLFLCLEKKVGAVWSCLCLEIKGTRQHEEAKLGKIEGNELISP